MSQLIVNLKRYINFVNEKPERLFTFGILLFLISVSFFPLLFYK